MTKKDFKDSITTQTTQLSSPAMAFVSASLKPDTSTASTLVSSPPAERYADCNCNAETASLQEKTPAVQPPSTSQAHLAHVSEAHEAISACGATTETKSKKTHLICRPSDMECALKIATMRRVSFNELMNIYMREGIKKDFKLIDRYNEVFGNENAE